jgi:hypothetical protein
MFRPHSKESMSISHNSEKTDFSDDPANELMAETAHLV